MSTTYLKQGNVLALTAPTGGVTSGAPIFVGNIFCIPKSTVAQTLSFDADVAGLHSLTKAGSQAWSEGDRVYWDIANTRCSSDCTAGPLIGIAAEAVGSGAGLTTGKVRLNEPCIESGIYHCRQRLPIATINAGATLVPAIPGCKFRLVDAFAIAYGGAVAAVTTVDILGTVTSDRKLVAFGQAALTQSAMVRAGAAAGVLLADGASFTANDVNTPLKVAVTGSPITTATGIDFMLQYAIEPA